ncbi:hypothetical protein SPHINGO8AM_130115 [Sphingomonas sp. 8AM]|nr:hypothetical protein SPHINGO8AM_130115 [Sphingomonas sp. 8AM]
MRRPARGHPSAPLAFCGARSYVRCHIRQRGRLAIRFPVSDRAAVAILCRDFIFRLNRAGLNEGAVSWRRRPRSNSSVRCGPRPPRSYGRPGARR